MKIGAQDSMQQGTYNGNALLRNYRKQRDTMRGSHRKRIPSLASHQSLSKVSCFTWSYRPLGDSPIPNGLKPSRSTMSSTTRSILKSVMSKVMATSSLSEGIFTVIHGFSISGIRMARYQLDRPKVGGPGEEGTAYSMRGGLYPEGREQVGMGGGKGSHVFARQPHCVAELTILKQRLKSVIQDFKQKRWPLVLNVRNLSPQNFFHLFRT